MSITRNLTRRITQAITRPITSPGVGGGGISNTVDLFIVCGQSNAVGIGDSAQSPAAPYGLYITGTTISALADPVGNANTGSAWPAFSNKWAELTGNRSAFTANASVGAALVTSGWYPAGSLRGAAVTACNNAITAINASAYDLGSVYFLWLQGETEAVTINGTTITGSTYEQALEDLATYFKAQVATSQPLKVIMIAGPGSSSSVTKQSAAHAGYQEIRAAQQRAANDSANIDLVYDGTFHFLARGYLTDGTHYSQTAYNLLGKMAARGVANGQEVLPDDDCFISSTNYADPSTGFGASRSANHTTASGTEFVIIAAGINFQDNNTTADPTATFGGIAMRRAAWSEVNGGSPAGNACAVIFYIDEDMYGAPLSGVTASVVVNTPNNQRMHTWTAIDAKNVQVCDAEAGSFPAAHGGTASVTDTITTFHPGLIVTVGASNADSASALTATMTNATELQDYGLSTGTRAGQCVIGYSEESAAVTAKAIGITWSATCTHMAAVTVAFRKKFTGE